MELNNLCEVISNSYSSVDRQQCQKEESLWNYMKVSNFEGVLAHQTLIPWAITYNISTGDLHQYNMGRSEFQVSNQPVGYNPVNPLIFMNNSSGMKTNHWNSQKFWEFEAPDSTNTSKTNTISTLEEAKSISKDASLSNKISLLKKVLEGIHDDTQILITSKPKNKSQKIRKSNRHSRYRGVSLNGKKWQVMIMGPIKKKYFGGISTEREAASFYDKLSILTNGLAAKTNFNYRKSDLMKMIPELEYMETIVS